LSKKLIIIPTYNEIENIENILNAVLSLGQSHNVLVVDDNSPDQTAEAVKQIQKNEERVFLLEREGKLGLGTAYIAGFRFGLEKGFDYIIEMDADFSHNPKDVPRLIAKCKEGYDICVGSRYTKGGGLENWSKYRLMLSYGASLYVRLMTGMPIKDPTAGFICYSRKALESIDFKKITFIGYAFQIQMKYACYTSGCSIAEIPIIFKDREAGTSKMNSSIIEEAIMGVIRMRGKDYKA